MNQAEDELQRKGERLALFYEANEFVISRQLEVQAAGLAWHLDLKTKTLRNWRTEGYGPRSRTLQGVTWYSCLEIVRWIECTQRAGRCVLASEPGARSESAAGGMRK